MTLQRCACIRESSGRTSSYPHQLSLLRVAKVGLCARAAAESAGGESRLHRRTGRHRCGIKCGTALHEYMNNYLIPNTSSLRQLFGLTDRHLLVAPMNDGVRLASSRQAPHRLHRISRGADHPCSVSCQAAYDTHFSQTTQNALPR